jgi:2-hydroxy-3-oxopropionate reductase
MEIGFIGLGVMGAPMALHILDAGYSVVTTLNKSPLPVFLNGRTRIADTPAEVAANCDIIITVLPDTADVEKVVRGPHGLLSAVGKQSLIIDMSSISPMATRDMSGHVKAKGADYMDAPVSGGEMGAKAGTLTIMASGSGVAFERAKPLFEMMGKNITLISNECGAGQICKIANQIIVALTIEAVSEALVLASKAGCDPNLVRQALMGGFAGSRVLEVHGERMIKRSFDPGFTIRLHQKDLGLALTTARILGVSLPSTAVCHELFNSSNARGDSDLDHSALVRSLEILAAHQVSSPLTTTMQSQNIPAKRGAI